MEVGQLADQAVRDLTTRLSGEPAGSQAGIQTGSQSGSATGDPLSVCFTLLAGADSWGKLALQRVCHDPGDGRAVQELRISLEQAARLHPPLAAQLERALGRHVTAH